MKKSPVRTIVAIGIGAALFFVLGRFVAIPSPVPNTNISVQYGLLAFMAAIYGPVAGALIGLIGHALIDFSYGWGVWWSWVIASGVFGVIIGLVASKLQLADGIFGKADAVKFNVFQVVGHIVSPCAGHRHLQRACQQGLRSGPGGRRRQPGHHCHRGHSALRCLCRSQAQEGQPEGRRVRFSLW